MNFKEKLKSLFKPSLFKLLLLIPLFLLSVSGSFFLEPVGTGPTSPTHPFFMIPSLVLGFIPFYLFQLFRFTRLFLVPAIFIPFTLLYSYVLACIFTYLIKKINENLSKKALGIILIGLVGILIFSYFSWSPSKTGVAIGCSAEPTEEIHLRIAGQWEEKEIKAGSECIRGKTIKIAKGEGYRITATYRNSSLTLKNAELLARPRIHIFLKNNTLQQLSVLGVEGYRVGVSR